MKNLIIAILTIAVAFFLLLYVTASGFVVHYGG